MWGVNFQFPTEKSYNLEFNGKESPQSESWSSVSLPPQRVEVRPKMACPFSVVVAIDFGTTSSGYAFSFTQDSEAIHMMRCPPPHASLISAVTRDLTKSSDRNRRWEGGDPGVANQKSPTSLLLTPDLRFHSFGFAARDFYHDLDPEEARHWLYFDKFKMKIHSTSVRRR